MELINSGAVQTDPMQLFADWCGLINRGHSITPVGSSDSHDVTRFIVGQGRTYIRCEDTDVGNLDIEAATKAFVDGRVRVSYGLMATLQVNDRYEPGDLVTLEDGLAELKLTAQVHAPSWGSPKSVTLYMNGWPRFSANVLRQDDATDPAAVTTLQWRIPLAELSHDVWFAVVAKGDGVNGPFWPTAKPYQSDSIDFTPYTFASTGPLRVDIDGDHEFTSAYQYAQQIVDQCGGRVPMAIERLDSCDRAIATQVASILLANDENQAAFSAATESASEPIRAALVEYQRARQQSIIAGLEQIE